MMLLSPGPSALFTELLKRPYGLSSRSNLFCSIKKCDGFIERLALSSRLAVHAGCVNTVCWSDDGALLLSGSDDRCLKLTNHHTARVLRTVKTGHQANIFSAKFMPGSNSSCVIACAGDGSVQYTDLTAGDETRLAHMFHCAAGTTYDVEPCDVTASGGSGGGQCFISCGEDSCVRLYDLRQKSRCDSHDCAHNILFSTSRAITAMAVSPSRPWQVCVACAGGKLCIYDLRHTEPSSTDLLLRQWHWLCDDTSQSASAGPGGATGAAADRVRATSLRYDSTGRYVLASFSGRRVLLYDLCATATSSTSGVPCTAVTSSSASRSGGVGRRRERRPQLRLRGDWSHTGPRARPDDPVSSSAAVSSSDNSSRRPDESVVTLLPSSSSSSSLIRRMESVLGQVFPEAIGALLQAYDSDDVRQGEGAEASAVRDRPVTRRVMRRIRFRRRLAAMGLLPDPDDDDAAAVSSSSSSESSLVPQQSVETAASADRPPAAADASHLAVSGDASAALTVTDPGDATPGAAAAAAGHILPASSSDQLSATVSSTSARSFSSTPSAAAATTPAPSSAGRSAANSFRVSDSSDQLDTNDDDDDDDDEYGDYESHQMTTPSAADFNRTETNRVSTQPRVVACYTGHRNLSTMIKEAAFWGDRYIVSGSDCGHAFVWNRYTAQLVNILEADTHVVNRVRPHPFDPVLATSGIDHDIKLWTPIAEQSVFSQQAASSLTDLNERMTQQSRHLVTIPTMFVLRMFSAANRSHTLHPDF